MSLQSELGIQMETQKNDNKNLFYLFQQHWTLKHKYGRFQKQVPNKSATKCFLSLCPLSLHWCFQWLHHLAITQSFLNKSCDKLGLIAAEACSKVKECHRKTVRVSLQQFCVSNTIIPLKAFGADCSMLKINDICCGEAYGDTLFRPCHSHFCDLKSHLTWEWMPLTIGPLGKLPQIGSISRQYGYDVTNHSHA